MLQISQKLLQSVEQVQVLYTDVDGTFVTSGCLLRDREGFTLKNAEAIYRLLQAGVDVVMTSGREKEKLKETARILGFQNYIANLGIDIVYGQGEKVISHFGIEVPDHQGLKNWIRNSGVLDSIFREFTGQIDYYQPWADMLRTHYLLIGELNDAEVVNFIDSHFPELRIINNGKVAPYQNFANPSAYHILPRNVGKQMAVKIDRKERKLAGKNLIGIGDSLEDLSIASEVAIFFLLDEDIPITRPNVIRVSNSDGRGFSRIIEFLFSHHKI